MSESDEVMQAHAAFYEAFQSLDTEKMERVWLQDQHIACIHPGWRKLVGWGPIMASWERIFGNVFEMSFELGEADLMMSGDLAVVVVEEKLTQRGYDGISHSLVLATNVFERVGGKWYMILHHGSPVIQPDDEPPPLQ
jgi:ketosteroid isomerase-like protein